MDQIKFRYSISIHLPASVLSISTVLPFLDFTTSPGFIAVPDGIFSVKGIRQATFFFNFNEAIPFMVPKTQKSVYFQLLIKSLPATHAAPILKHRDQYIFNC